VKTRWNSTYDLAKVALKYRLAIDDITANKSLKLHKFELDNDDWKIIGDLL
jgi:collagenase-like PrtC family protease